MTAAATNKASSQPENKGSLLALAKLEKLKTIAILGLSKNAGKTTCLNHIINAWRAAGNTRTLALTSIGRDGEEEDVVGGHAKPKIYVSKGTLVATAESALYRSDALFDIHTLTGIRTAFGEVILARAVSDGYAELAGPSIAEELKRCEKLLRAIAPDCLFIVDGALSRRSQAGGGLSEAAILAVGAEASPRPDELAEKARHAMRLLAVEGVGPRFAKLLKKNLAEGSASRAVLVEHSEDFAGLSIRSLPMNSLIGRGREVCSALKGQVQALFLRGAITDNLVRELLNCKEFRKLTLIVEDGTRLFISAENLSKLERSEVKLAALSPLKVHLVCVNPFRSDGSSADADAIIKAVRSITKIPVVNLGPALN